MVSPRTRLAPRIVLAAELNSHCAMLVLVKYRRHYTVRLRNPFPDPAYAKLQ